MLDDFNRLFQLVHNKAVRIETFIAKTEQHGRSLVKSDAIPAESPAGSSRLIMLFQQQNRQALFSQQCRSSQTAQSRADDNDISIAPSPCNYCSF